MYIQRVYTPVENLYALLSIIVVELLKFLYLVLLYCYTWWSITFEHEAVIYVFFQHLISSTGDERKKLSVQVISTAPGSEENNTLAEGQTNGPTDGLRPPPPLVEVCIIDFW